MIISKMCSKLIYRAIVNKLMKNFFGNIEQMMQLDERMYFHDVISSTSLLETEVQP